jgi:hypothetical protein
MNNATLEYSNQKEVLLRKLKIFQIFFTRQQIKTIRGQVLKGDYAGAQKGIDSILSKKECKLG